MTGYTPCACRDCMEIAIGEPGVAMCHDCDEAGCTAGEEGCLVDPCMACGAYTLHPEDCVGCEHAVEDTSPYAEENERATSH